MHRNHDLEHNCFLIFSRLLYTNSFEQNVTMKFVLCDIFFDIL